MNGSNVDSSEVGSHWWIVSRYDVRSVRANVVVWFLQVVVLMNANNVVKTIGVVVVTIIIGFVAIVALVLGGVIG